MSKPCHAPVLIATLAFAASVQGAPPAHDHEHHDHKTNAPAPAADAQSVRWTADADLRKGMADVHAALDVLRPQATEH